MSELKLLYGASVQGIQGFIFQTNKLRDISGASELVEEICTITFAKLLYQQDLSDDDLKSKLQKDPRVLLNAAGNIKFEPDSRELCERIVREFPKLVQQKAPGITVSQAVVSYSDAEDFSSAIIRLEGRLREQRNKPMRSNTLGLMGIRRSRTTGLPAVRMHKSDYVDAATLAKLYKDAAGTIRRETIELCRKALFKEVQTTQVPYDISSVTDKNDWIAVIHADGNGLGQIVQKIGHNREEFKRFSMQLDDATQQAARTAYAKIEEKYGETWKRKETQIIPIRPVVLGGDDFTVICRADFALEYVTHFIEAFEINTHKMDCFKEGKYPIYTEGRVRDRLTACAGIAYVKSSYPFYYAYDLAEALCTEAKKNAKDKPSIKAGKELPASCIMFHKLQDSFVDSYEELKQRELCPHPALSFAYGPYYLNDHAAQDHEKWTVAHLLKQVVDLSPSNNVRAHLRNWMSTVFDNKALAKQHIDRLKKREPGWSDRLTAWTTQEYSPVYDILAIYTLQNQQTN